MIVASYLIRLEPFTQVSHCVSLTPTLMPLHSPCASLQMFLALQGGNFDHPDRMFHSIKEAWESASEHVCVEGGRLSIT